MTDRTGMTGAASACVESMEDCQLTSSALRPLCVLGWHPLAYPFESSTLFEEEEQGYLLCKVAGPTHTRPPSSLPRPPRAVAAVGPRPAG